MLGDKTHRVPTRIILLVLLLSILSHISFGEENIPYRTHKVLYEAQKFLEKKDYRSAKEILLEYIKSEKDSHYLIYFMLGNTFSLCGEEKEAETYLKRCVLKNPSFFEGWANLGKVQFDLGEYKEASQSFLSAFRIKRDPELLYFCSISYISLDKPKDALSYLQKLCSGEFGKPKIEWQKALLQVYLDLKDYKKAKELLKRLIEEDSNNPKWWRFLAEIEIEEGKYAKAIVPFTVYSYLKPLKPEESMTMGDLYFSCGIYFASSLFYEKAIKSGKNNETDVDKYVSSLILSHETKKAINFLKEVLNRKTNKKFAKLYFTLGLLLYREKKYKDAYNSFLKSFELGEKKGESLMMMGYCALKMGNLKLARSSFEKAEKFPKQKKKAKSVILSIKSLEEKDR